MEDNKKANDIWTSRWDDRYSNDEFAYGEEPNALIYAHFPANGHFSGK